MQIALESNIKKINPRILTKYPLPLPNAFLSAVIIFTLLNFILHRLDSRRIIVDKTRNAHYFDFPTVRRLCLDKNARNKHEIIFLGSSLFNQPFWALDKQIAATNCPDARHYHAIIYLNQQLEKLGNKAQLRSLAIGGALISDYYLLLNKYLTNTNSHPALVIVDCAPRAFFDSGLINGKETPIFDYLFDEKDLLSIGNYYLPTFSDHLEFLLQHYCFLSKHRRSLSDSWKNTMQQSISSLYNFLPSKNIADIPQETNKTNTIGTENQKLIDSLNEYRRHYNGISTSNIQTQMTYLYLIAHTCRSNDIKLLFINMPLTDSNKKLLPPQFYDFYCRSLQNSVLPDRKNVYFIDLDKSKYFNDLDFDDSAHLNHKGAKKLEDQISQFITNNKNTRIRN